jgi:vancomycin resistance protein YoaR
MGVGVLAMRARNNVRAHTFIGAVYVGNMPTAKAEHTLRAWWAKEADHQIEFKSDLISDTGTASPDELGIGFDVKASLAQAPRASILDMFRKVAPTHIAPILTVDGTRLADLKSELETHLKDPSKAKVLYLAGKFDRQPETGEAEVDLPRLEHDLLLAVLHRSNVIVPFKEGGKRVTNADLATIKEVEGQFTTHFPTGKKSRCSNIQLASSKLNGIVLMPGDRVSFNNTVGRRTEKAGFQIAGVYKNGKHDVDVGGGICQVSTTLYNAALLADLKIVQRHNHSMPVAYVPLGRDATVDYGALDLEIENNMDHPIALNSQYEAGRLTFRILGKKDPTLDVKIESDGRQRWDAGTQVIFDPTLAPGKKKVVDKGASGQQISTYRVVYRGGKLVAREPLGKSYYKGGQKIIAVGRGNEASSSGMRLVSSNSH